MSERDTFIKMALSAWQMQISRFNQLLDKLSDEQLLADTAPGRNSGKYILGHLTAVHDNLLQQLELGNKLYPELDAVFISSPDKSGLETPELPALKQYWNTVNDTLWEHFEALSPESWFSRHALISEEDFAKEPYRNKLNMVINRAGHVAYHLGQMVYLKQ